MRWILSALGGLAIVLILVGWIAAAPQFLGGRAVYVTTAGASMEPTISAGDLVVLRKSTGYQVGDIVAYDAGTSVVLHRIIGTDGERFILQGDNNAVPDPIRPTANEILGQFWLLLAPPWDWDISEVILVAGPIVLLVAVAVVVYLSRKRIASSEPMQRLAANSSIAQNGERYVRLLGPLGQIVVAIIATLGIGALLLAAAGFSRPLEKTVVERVSYQHNGTFSYSAQADGGVYDGDLATTGDPLYRDVIDTVTIAFDYALRSESSADASGTYRIDLVVSNDDSWSTTLPLVPQGQFSGSQFSETGILDLGDVESVIDRFEEQTALDTIIASPLYQMSIVPLIRVDGAIGNHQIHDSFVPTLAFQVDDRAITLLDSPNDELTASSATESRVTNTIPEEHVVANKMAFLFGDLEVATARQLAIIGLALTVVLGVAALLMIRSAMHAPEPGQIEARYGSRVVDLRAASLEAFGRMIELETFEDLAKIADERESHILHGRQNGRHFYLVHTADVTYGYRTIDRDDAVDPAQSPEASELEASEEEALKDSN